MAIARALTLNPDLMVLDEPVSALDMSTQAQIINLLQELQATRGLTYLFVSHNPSVVHHLAHRIGVMKAGELVEVGTADQVVEDPQHPYTRRLLGAVLRPDPLRPRGESNEAAPLAGEEQR
jgi:ABC-type oligopeptide transport system ATPase subunit